MGTDIVTYNTLLRLFVTSEMNSLSKVDDLLSQMERSNIEWDNATFLTLLSYYQSLYHTDDGKARMWGLVSKMNARSEPFLIFYNILLNYFVKQKDSESFS